MITELSVMLGAYLSGNDLRKQPDERHKPEQKRIYAVRLEQEAGKGGIDEYI